MLTLHKIVMSALAATALVAGACFAQEDSAGDDARLTVVELFTSQGCSSCPPADANLQALASQPDLLTLSWPVDYWDRLGWRDTFGSAMFTRRQRAYNKRMGRSGVYTPQMVIDGRYQAIGSRKGDVRDAIGDAREAIGLYVQPSIKQSGNAYQVDLPSTMTDGTITVHVVWYMAGATVEVGSGENGGRKLHYTNIVRESEFVRDWKGDATTITLPGMQQALAKGADHVAVLLQKGFGDGPIVGAARMPIDGTSSR